MNYVDSLNPHFSDFAAMGLPAERGKNAFGILAQPPKTIRAPKPKAVKKYPQMTKTQKAASVFMTPAERKAWREELAAQQ